MSVLDRASLENSPLADLHAIASQLGLDGYRRLRKAELIDRILDHQGVEDGAAADGDESAAASKRRRGRRGGRGRAAREADGGADADVDGDVEAEAEETPEPVAEDKDEDDELPKPKPARRSRTTAAKPKARAKAAEQPGEQPAEQPTEQPTEELAEDEDEDEEAPRARRSRRGARKPAAVRATEAEAETEADDEDHQDEPGRDRDVVEGVVELLANGSGFMRVAPPDPSDDDVYISAAQVKRCELITGDRIAGPRRPPRRSERFPSLVRIDVINGVPAVDIGQAVRFEDLPAAYPDTRFKLGVEDATIKAIEWLTPFGKGSRVTIVGPARSGKTEALLGLAAALKSHDDVQLNVVLAGARPEESAEWEKIVEPVANAGLAASADARAGVIESAIETARRHVARGADVVVLIDGLDGVGDHAARKALAAARNVVDGGSLTVIATASAQIGGETTVIALDLRLTSTGRFPALDLATSGTIRPELLVGSAGADAIARARAEAIEG